MDFGFLILQAFSVSIIFLIVFFIGAFYIEHLIHCRMRDEFMDDDKLKRKFKKDMLKKVRFIDKKDEFEIIYNKFEELIKASNINEIKQECEKNSIRNRLICICFAVPILLGIIIILTKSFNDMLKLLSLLLVLLVVESLLIDFIIWFKNRPSKYKVEVVKNFLKAVDCDIKHISNFEKDLEVENIYEDIYMLSGFRDKKCNETEIKNYIEYCIKPEISVKMVDLHLIKQNSGRQKTVHYIYDGFVVKLTREKYIENEILIERNKRFKRENIISDFSDKFKKCFDVYAKENTNINLILSKSVQEQIISLYKEYGIMFEISLKGNNIFIRFFNGELFESILYSGDYNKDKLYKEYIIFTNILEIIKKISEII